MFGMNGWCKPDGDLISRAAAIDALDVLCQEHRYKIPGKGETYSQYNEAWQDALDRAEGAIFNLPSAQPDTGYSDGYADGYKQGLKDAQPERMRGKWIERNPRNSPDCRLIECSECGNAYIVGYNINYDDWIDGRNFCMKCGADLRGGSNGKNT